MAQTTIHRSWVAFALETTVGVPPADATAWAADGIAIEHTAVDVASIKQTWIPDPTLEGRAFAVGTRRMIPGVRNVNMTVGAKLHGVGAETASGTQVTDTYLAKLLKHCMGATHRGTSRVVTGGSSTAPVVNDSTGIIPGSFVAFQDITSPAAIDTGKVHLRRVLSVDGGTHALTLSEALPFTPANTDKAHAAITGYLDEDILEDAVASAGGPHTLSWFVKKAKAGTDHLWQAEGSVASMQIQGLGRGELPSLQLGIMAGNFRTGGADSLELPTFTTIQGHAQLSMGLDVLCSIQDYGTTAVNLQDVNTAAFDPGFTRSPVPTNTEKTNRFEGLASWSFTPGNTRFSITLLPYSDDWYTDLHAGQFFRINFYNPGDGSGAGKAWGLHLPRAQLVDTPSPVVVGDVHGVTLVFQAMEPDDCSGGSNEDLEKSRFYVVLA